PKTAHFYSRGFSQTYSASKWAVLGLTKTSAIDFAVIGVFTEPGCMEFTRTPSTPKSIAEVLVKPKTAHFEAEYAARCLKPESPAIDDTFTIEDVVFFLSSGNAAFIP